MRAAAWTLLPAPRLLLLLLLCSALAGPSSSQRSEGGVPPALTPSLELLLRVLEAMDRGLDFMAAQSADLNLDGVIGLRMVADQLSLFLQRSARGLLTSGSGSKLRLLTEVNALRWKASSAVEDAVPEVRKHQPAYFHTLGLLLKEGQWALDYPVRSLPEEPRPPREVGRKKVMVTLVEAYSDSCVHEMTGSSYLDKSACNVSDYCWDLMTSPGYVGYALTHQVFYLEIGQMSGCSREMKRLSLDRGQGNASVLQDWLCGSVFKEARLIQEKGYPEKDRDLLMEQVALCGVLGYREFLDEDWLRALLSWQDATGCYTRPEFAGGTGRSKREDKKLRGSCSSHKTSVALGALVASAKFLLQAIVQSSAVYH